MVFDCVSGKVTLNQLRKALKNPTARAYLNSPCDFWGRTPLYYAAYFGDYELVKLLCEYGADPEYYTHGRDSYGFTSARGARLYLLMGKSVAMRETSRIQQDSNRFCLSCADLPMANFGPDGWCSRAEHDRIAIYFEGVIDRRRYEADLLGVEIDE